MNPYLFDAAILATLAFVIYQLTIIGKAIMSTQDQVDALTAQVVKVGEEVQTAKAALEARLADVQAQLDAAGADDVDLSSLSQAIQALDDINPDVPVEEVDESNI